MKEPVEDERDFTVQLPNKLVLDFKKAVMKRGINAKYAVMFLMAAVVDGQLGFTIRKRNKS